MIQRKPYSPIQTFSMENSYLLVFNTSDRECAVRVKVGKFARKPAKSPFLYVSFSFLIRIVTT